MPDTSTPFETPLAEPGDRALVDDTAKAITPPKVKASSSFVLHAPMELIARARLLGLAPPNARPKGRRRIADIATRYADEGPEVEPVSRTYADEAAALANLTGAILARDAEGADGALVWLLERASTRALIAGLADAVIPALGAAGHAPILLAMFLRSPEAGEAYGQLLRAPVRYLTLHGDARLTWPTRPDGSTTAVMAGLTEALLSPPRVHSPSLFIAPTMRAVETDGFAERLLAGPTQSLPLEEAERALLRLAALSMLQDDRRHAPYGWTHCLTTPQGILTLAAVARDKRAAIRVAATHVLGFRATLGRARLDPERPPPPLRQPACELRPVLAAHAVAHKDAHLAKYTLACLDAADRDPEAESLYLAAAAYLHAWWDENPNAGFGD
jgi:hypothetical protein